MSETFKVQKDVAQELAYSSPGDAIEDDDGTEYLVMLNEQVGSRRWVSEHDLVINVAAGDLYYSASYEQGLTEYQDLGPFEDDPDPVVFTRVYPHEVTSIEYRSEPAA